MSIVRVIDIMGQSEESDAIAGASQVYPDILSLGVHRLGAAIEDGRKATNKAAVARLSRRSRKPSVADRLGQ